MTANKPTCAIKLDEHSDWEPCRIYHLGHGQNHYIRLATNDQTITVYGTSENLSKVLSKLLLAVDPPRDGLRNDIDRVSAITPAEVIEYFRNSPALAQLADDVEAILGPLARSESQSDLDIVRSSLDVSELFNDGRPVRGAQTAIADVLEIPNAGSYRKRILAVLDQLKSTTTPKKPEKGRNAA